MIRKGPVKISPHETRMEYSRLDGRQLSVGDNVSPMLSVPRFKSPFLLGSGFTSGSIILSEP